MTIMLSVIFVHAGFAVENSRRVAATADASWSWAKATARNRDRECDATFVANVCAEDMESCGNRRQWAGGR